ncbi:MAG TPA: hypothetical protein VJ792_09175 [Candidatus Nitrosotalea sp.]|nr:hypothetical protein [Candidatus Nitrosotalea sp.]
MRILSKVSIAALVAIVVCVAVAPSIHPALAQADNSPLQQKTQNGATMEFYYSPSSPSINGYTTLTFSLVNASNGNPIQNYVGFVTVGNVVNYTGGSGYYNFSSISVTNGTFSVSYAFPNDGLFPVFFRANYPSSTYGPGSPIAIGEFKVLVPPPQALPSDNTMLYVGIGIAAAAGGGAAAVILLRRKPSSY